MHHLEHRNIVNDLMKTLNGEFQAICFYEYLANCAPNEVIRDRILEIRKDEMRHYAGFAYIYTCLTGMHPTPQLSDEPYPKTFQEGVHAAFIDEQQAVEFYHQVARETQDCFISNAYMQASFDEQNHAVWFLYFMRG